jgi:hypothetical protein
MAARLKVLRGVWISELDDAVISDTISQVGPGFGLALLIGGGYEKKTYQQVDCQERVDALLTKGIATLTDAEKEEIRDLYRGDGDWTCAFYTPPAVAPLPSRWRWSPS